MCGVLFLLLAGSENFLYHLVEKMGGGTGTQTTVLSRIQGTDTSYLILLAIVISLFIGSEYTYGTIKTWHQSITRGMKSLLPSGS